MKLNHKQLQALKPKSKPYKVSDGKGLYVEVTATGSVLWRFRYEFAGKAKLISFGPFPEVSLKRARELRDEARQFLRDGIDPSQKRREKKTDW